MNKEFAQSFFPFVTSYASSPERAPAFILHVWNFIFPDICNQQMPFSYGQTTSPLQLQRPCLAVAAVLGAYIGIRYGREVTNSNQKRDLISVINKSWSKSSIFFGCMNISALVHHCIFPNNVSWASDCAFTGVSSLNLFTTATLLWILYGIEFSERFQKIMEQKTIESIERYNRILEGATKVAVAIMIHTAMSVLGESEVEVSIAAASNAVELFYFTPLGMAVFVLFPITLIGVFFKSNNASCRGQLIALLGGVLITGATLLGEPICKFVSDYMPGINDSSLLYDCYHLPTVVFLGCDVSFYGMGIWIKDLTSKKRQDL
mmetsp:Transcript_5050/g.10630  ORF Transcript_5050/g.10630 Transcript_5050/m.10630 type:complete len:319 (-) Transcript_5050:1862-2818(-)